MNGSLPGSAQVDSGTKEKGRVHLRCFEMKPAIFSMSNDATGSTFFSVASGLMMRPVLSLFFLMYTQMAFVTSVRGITFLPQTAASSAERVFGAKMPLPAFFMALAFFAPAAFCALLLRPPFTRLPLESFVIFGFFTAFFAPLRAARLAAMIIIGAIASAGRS